MRTDFLRGPDTLLLSLRKAGDQINPTQAILVESIATFHKMRLSSGLTDRLKFELG
jgi:hypothetical protein